MGDITEKLNIKDVNYEKLVELAVVKNLPDFIIAEMCGVGQTTIRGLRDKHNIKIYNSQIHFMNAQLKREGSPKAMSEDEIKKFLGSASFDYDDRHQSIAMLTLEYIRRTGYLKLPEKSI
jgi:hypothetical protein